jgi:hypothetical protein
MVQQRKFTSISGRTQKVKAQTAETEALEEGVIYMFPVVQETTLSGEAHKAVLKFAPTKLMKYYNEKKWEKLSDEMLAIFNFFERNPVTRVQPNEVEPLMMLAKMLVQFIASEEYVVPKDFEPYLVKAASTISNLARMVPPGTTDIYLKQALDHSNNIAKILALYSPRNKIRLNLDDVFGLDNFLASYWWSALIFSFQDYHTEELYNNMRELFLSDAPYKNFTYAKPNYPKLVRTEYLMLPPFHVVYLAPEKEGEIRALINQNLRQYIQALDMPVEGANPKKILIASASFHKQHATFRAMSPLIKSLKSEGYHLTFLNLRQNVSEKMFDLSAFDDSIFPEFDNFLLSEKSFEQVKKGKFGTTIYVENSLSATSVVMANMRISPVQITCYGHPVSSGGTQMDYYIGGAEVECDVKKQPQQHYNERLVIIPGLASSPVKPTYELQNFTDKNDFTVVTCSWGKIKSNYPMIKNLQTIRDKSKTKFKFLFNGIEGTNFSYLTFTNDLVDLLGADSVVAMHQLPNEDYMYNLERSDMGVDAFPFGGYTRVIDYVWVRRPVVVLEGQRAFNRQGSAVLRRLGLDELIARNEDEYIKKSIKLIDDAGYREELTTKMKKLDLDKLLFNNANNAYFAKAVSYIIQNHKNLQKQKSKTPVFVN